MTRRSLVAAAVLAFALPLRAQDPEPALVVELAHDKDTLRLKGTVDMPEGAVLRISLAREELRLRHARTECTVEARLVPLADVERVEVHGRAFSATIPLPGPGVYQVTVSYSPVAQRREEVLDKLGENYARWRRAYVAWALDTAHFSQAVDADRAALKPIADRLAALAQGLDRGVPADALAQLRRDLPQRTMLTGSLSALSQAIDKVRSCGPEMPKLGFAPGTPQAEALARASHDIPDGVNDEWQRQLARAYVARAARLLDREGALIALNLVRLASEGSAVAGHRPTRSAWDELRRIPSQ